MENAFTPKLMPGMDITVNRRDISAGTAEILELLHDHTGDLIDYALELMTMYVDTEVHTFISPHFESMLETSVIALLREHIKHLYMLVTKRSTGGRTRFGQSNMLMFDDMFVGACEYYMDNAYPTLYSKVTPMRSYRDCGIRNAPDVPKITTAIEYIKNLYQPDQRSEAWYNYRHEFITASSIGKVFGTPSAINQLIYEKCEPVRVFGGGSVNTNSPLHWGQKFEDVSVMLYEDRHSTKIGEFGCIKSDETSCIGASPDGINVDPTSPLFGRMLEIKNPFSRVIDGNPKTEYWIQMQFQMYVCHLKECDFLETKFVEYESRDAFYADGTFLRSDDEGKQKGIMLRFDVDFCPKYEYKPINMEEREFIAWKAGHMETYGEMDYVGEVYWKIDVYSCVMVLKNNRWLEYAVPHVQRVWDIIVEERVTGYAHRAAKKRVKKETVADIMSECQFDLGIDHDGEMVIENVPTINTNPTTKPNRDQPIDGMKGFELRVRTQSFDDAVAAMEG